MKLRFLCIMNIPNEPYRFADKKGGNNLFLAYFHSLTLFLKNAIFKLFLTNKNWLFFIYNLKAV